MKNKAIYNMSQEFFIEMDDYQSDTRDKIKIVAPERYNDFIEFVLKLRIKPQIKIIAILQISSGSRVSEILNLKRKHLDLNKQQITIKVLKKKKRKNKIKFSEWIPPTLLKLITPPNEDKIKLRHGAVNPKLIPLLTSWVEGLSPEDKIFSISRFGVLKAYKTLWGITTHSLRHSFITYMIEVRQRGWDWIMNHFYFTELKTAHRYFKQSTAIEADKIFKESA